MLPTKLTVCAVCVAVMMPMTSSAGTPSAEEISAFKTACPSIRNMLHGYGVDIDNMIAFDECGEEFVAAVVSVAADAWNDTGLQIAWPGRDDCELFVKTYGYCLQALYHSEQLGVCEGTKSGLVDGTRWFDVGEVPYDLVDTYLNIHARLRGECEHGLKVSDQCYRLLKN